MSFHFRFYEKNIKLVYDDKKFNKLLKPNKMKSLLKKSTLVLSTALLLVACGGKETKKSTTTVGRRENAPLLRFYIERNAPFVLAVSS